MGKFILDENLSRKLIERLSPIFTHITHVSNEELSNCSDTEVWRFAKNNQFTIVTKDYDFSDMSHLLGCPPKVIKLNCGNKTTGYICDILISKAELIEMFIGSNNCYMEIF